MLKATYEGIRTEEGWRRRTIHQLTEIHKSPIITYNIRGESTESKMTGACGEIGWKKNGIPSTTQKTNSKEKDEQVMNKIQKNLGTIKLDGKRKEQPIENNRE